MPDFRAAERTFQLLTQVAGRAGRGQSAGPRAGADDQSRIITRSGLPQRRISSLSTSRRLHFRKAMRYPPFSALANVLLRSEKQEDAMRMSTELAHLLTPPPENIKVLGPAEAPVPRLKNEYRYQLLIKAKDRRALNRTLQQLAVAMLLDHKWSATALVIDVDPLDFVVIGGKMHSVVDQNLQGRHALLCVYRKRERSARLSGCYRSFLGT